MVNASSSFTLILLMSTRLGPGIVYSYHHHFLVPLSKRVSFTACMSWQGFTSRLHQQTTTKERFSIGTEERQASRQVVLNLLKGALQP